MLRRILMAAANLVAGIYLLYGLMLLAVIVLAVWMAGAAILHIFPAMSFGTFLVVAKVVTILLVAARLVLEVLRSLLRLR